MENITFNVGDYSVDGHGFCAELIVESNKSVKELREIHLKENEFIGNICSEYEDSKLSLTFLYEFLEQYHGHEEAVKMIQSFISEHDLEVVNYLDEEEEITEKAFIDLSFQDFEINFEDKPKEFLALWLLLLKVVDNSFSYKILSEPLSKYEIKYKGYQVEINDNFIYSKRFEREYKLKIPGYGIWSCNGSEEFYTQS